MAKKISIGGPGKSDQDPAGTPSAIMSFLNKGAEGEVRQEKQPPPQDKPKGNKPGPKKGTTTQNAPPEKPKTPTLPDRRQVSDKKVPFSSNIRASLAQQIELVLREYRQTINFEYTKAQFLEDAFGYQLNKLRRELGNRKKEGGAVK